MMYQRAVHGIGAVLPGSSVLSTHAIIKVMLLIQMISAVRALPLANKTTSIDKGGACLGRDRHAIKHNNDSSDGLCFYHPYSEYDDWVVSGGLKMARQNKTMNDANIAKINIYSQSKLRSIKYDSLHTFWSNLPANAYVVKTFDDNEDKLPLVKSVLKIFWTIDKSHIADNMRIIAARERDNERLPKLPDFIDVGNMLSREDYWRVLQDTLQEAFDYWSTILYGRVVFEYVEYNARLKNATNFNRVIMVSMQDMQHVDEHTNVEEAFSSKNTLAHASINLIHFNRETTVFYIAPHLTAKRVYIVVERKNSINNASGALLYEVSGEDLARRYRMKNYAYLYEQSRTVLSNLLNGNNPRSWCLLCVAIHEIGHVMGLGHTDDRQSVMYAFYRSDEVIHYEEDKQAIRELFSGVINRTETIEMNNTLQQCQQIRRRQMH